MLYKTTGQERDKIYCRSMGKIFEIRAICATVDEANDYCAKHPATAVIAEMSTTEIIIADVYGHTVPSFPIGSCTWNQNEDGAWETGCDNCFEITNGTPRENSMAYCTYCGKPLLEIGFTEPVDDTEDSI